MAKNEATICIIVATAFAVWSLHFHSLTLLSANDVYEQTGAEWGFVLTICSSSAIMLIVAGSTFIRKFKEVFGLVAA